MVLARPVDQASSITGPVSPVPALRAAPPPSDVCIRQAERSNAHVLRQLFAPGVVERLVLAGGVRR